MSRVANRKRSGRGLLAVLIILILAAGAIWIWKSRIAVSPERVVLAPVTFHDLPGWNASDARAALAAFERSCVALQREPPTRSMGGAGYAGTVGDWQGICATAPSGRVGAEGARGFFEDWFIPVSVSARDGSPGLFTGYYEPEIRASATRHGRFATPIYGLPADLVGADLGLFSDDLKGRRVEGRVSGNALVPYFTRGEIDRFGLPAAQVLLYADDPVQVFFLHIQGSGRALLENGAIVRLAYAGQNGRPYTPVGRILIGEGAIDRTQMSMQAIREWMRTHTDEARHVMENDESFVFFREAPLGDPSLGSPGSEGVALTPGASIAVDTRLHSLGAPFFIATTAPDPDPARPDRPLDHLFVAQDTGGAIKGAARADIFWGFGPSAESVAGRLKSAGKLYVFVPKPLAARLPAGFEAGAR